MATKKKKAAAKAVKSKAAETASQFGYLYGTEDNFGYGTGFGSPDWQVKTATIGTAGFSMKWTEKTYRPAENFRLNAALFACVPYLHAGIIVRANYSLGLPFLFKDEDTDETTEEIYMDNFARRIHLKKLLMKTSIHLDVYGNCYWYIDRSKEGVVNNIKVIQPERVTVDLNKYGEVEVYNVFLPRYDMQGIATKTFEIKPKDMIHFKFKEYTERPYGVSIIQPIVDLLMTRLDLNKITPIIYKAYGKPYRHWQYTPANENETDEAIQNTVNEMRDMLEKSEPDSDVISTNAWKSEAVTVGGRIDPSTLVQDIDEQTFAVLGMPKYFFKPSGTTDLNISKADMWFKYQMQNRCEDFSTQFTEEITIPELDLIFTDSSNIPMISFESDFDLRLMMQQAQALLSSGLIDRDEGRKMIGKEPQGGKEGEAMVPIEEKPPAAVKIEAVKTARDWALRNDLDLYEKWQDGDIDTAAFVKKTRVI